MEPTQLSFDFTRRNKVIQLCMAEKRLTKANKALAKNNSMKEPSE
jgi:hypothetical protein